jgi:hypothetical protein
MHESRLGLTKKRKREKKGAWLDLFTGFYPRQLSAAPFFLIAASSRGVERTVA